jgi:hypothetical protein
MTSRGKDDWQAARPRGIRKKWTITFDENDPGALHAETRRWRRRIRQARLLVTRAALHAARVRSVECRAALRHVLVGARRRGQAVPVVDRDERQRMQVFGACRTGGAPISGWRQSGEGVRRGVDVIRPERIHSALSAASFAIDLDADVAQIGFAPVSRRCR